MKFWTKITLTIVPALFLIACGTSGEVKDEGAGEAAGAAAGARDPALRLRRDRPANSRYGRRVRPGARDLSTRGRRGLLRRRRAIDSDAGARLGRYWRLAAAAVVIQQAAIH